MREKLKEPDVVHFHGLFESRYRVAILEEGGLFFMENKLSSSLVVYLGSKTLNEIASTL